MTKSKKARIKGILFGFFVTWFIFFSFTPVFVTALEFLIGWAIRPIYMHLALFFIKSWPFPSSPLILI